MAKKKISNNAEAIIKAISVVDYVYGMLLIIFGLVFLFGGTVLASMMDLSRIFPNMMLKGVIGGFFVIISIFMLIYGGFYIYLGKSIKEKKQWAKVFQIVLAVLGLFSFPIGTIMGIFMIWALLINKETKDIFH